MVRGKNNQACEEDQFVNVGLEFDTDIKMQHCCASLLYCESDSDIICGN